ncbi:MAG: hypothetical protein A2951_00355 [Candidatus Buchananbacteria bacterium RIFCSPLOWO2_01_FULL_56_15]|uniref:Transcription termination/antitermination protein NusA n=1 Tax=Candidatus Buchananbacteria bacterium RIFCSPLOWO2_01_FULL_56_15 TaxID=1797547 RepID=A0A1G1YTC5_9BACT|nr:MAG: hypothetical protein A2951_00355 [Candidatus Buchananbacteria bacterium RIFCSPLOWO2_01_FULL_56_15]
MDQKSIAEAVKQICDEKGIPFEAVIETIEAALAAAYRKDFGEKNQNVKVEFDIETGLSKIFDVKTVVDDVPEEVLAAELAAAEQRATERREPRERRAPAMPTETPPAEGEEGEEVKRFNPKTDLQIADAKKMKKGVTVGDVIKTPLSIPGEFGRMAAQTAKQVITQKLREIERESLYGEYKQREGEILVGTVQRREGRLLLIDLGRLTALLPPEEQIHSESYTPGGHIKVYILSVDQTTKGPQIIVSRVHPEIVRKLFALEIPEIANGTVQIKAIAREAGSRSKVAVWTDEENIDPIGSCIGQRGARIQTIISELKGEKVDIIKYSEDAAEFISNALLPAKVLDVQLNEATRTATAKVAEDQLSLAIGKAGQNVRLAAKLSGWKIDIISNAPRKTADDAAPVADEQGPSAHEAPTEEPAAEPEADAASTETKPKTKKKKAAAPPIEASDS